MDDRYALGYKINNNKSYDSYKILRFPYGCNQLEIFLLKSNSWRVLANITTKVRPPNHERGVSLKRNTYWISYLKFAILIFDFTTERYRHLHLPFTFSYQNFGFNIVALSADKEEQLLVSHWCPDTQQMETWLSNKIDTETVLSWRSFTFDLCSQLDIRFPRFVSFFIDEEDKVIVCCGRTMVNKKNMICIFGNQGYRKFYYDTDQTKHPWLFLFSYVPSLVTLNHDKKPYMKKKHH